MVAKRDAQGQDILVSLKGNATIRELDTAKTAFGNAMLMGRPIRLDVSEVREVDLSFVQVLIGVAYTCSRKKIDFAVLRSGEDHPFMRYIQKIGLKSLRFVQETAPRASDHAAAGK